MKKTPLPAWLFGSSQKFWEALSFGNLRYLQPKGSKYIFTRIPNGQRRGLKLIKDYDLGFTITRKTNVVEALTKFKPPPRMEGWSTSRKKNFANSSSGAKKPGHSTFLNPKWKTGRKKRGSEVKAQIAGPEKFSKGKKAFYGKRISPGGWGIKY